MIHDLKTNGATRPSIAEQRQAAHNAPSLPSAPVKAARKLPAWVLPLVGLAVGAAAAFGVSYELMPVKATPVERVFADVDGDGAPDLIVSGMVIFAPKSDGQ